MSFFIASQILVGLASLFDIASFQFKSRTKLLATLTISALLIAAHFALLQEWTAACLLVIGACRYFAGIFISDPRMKWLFYFVTVLGTILTFSDLVTTLSCIGSLLHTKASFTANDKLMRWLMVIGTLVWVAHDILVGSPVAVLLGVLFIISSGVGYYRLHIKKAALIV
ncbi:YgjV family protein [Vibrio splendidus]|uniref:YgjV family protein n=1 Tax=Vibrio splendidus TaxID=29497 RepID=UPI0022355005|nr:YgjV family protein [Vibrio splendidus]MCW4443746.1 YgjV family protein [Vibrio splendidus]